MFFEITHKEKHTRARTGILRTEHGEIETPVFMPVGTQATVKSLDSADLHNLRTQIILANTYHLHLRPGEDIIADFGGLHNFMQWDGPILTDSGGFQVFSLAQTKKGVTEDETNGAEHAKLVSIDEEGVTFRSHIDGSTRRFTPESAIEIQHKLGADIIMAFDECTPDNANDAYTIEAMERTHRWAGQSLAAHKKNPTHHGYKQFLFGIIQGANHEDLRKQSAEYISGLDFDGIAIGGESIGYNMEATKQILDWVYPILPEQKPHYTMGLGHSPRDLFEVVERGIDMFDCVSPTRMARNGTLFVHPSIEASGRIMITNSKYKTDHHPIDATFDGSPIQNYSRAYLHHLFKTQELLAYRIATLHNLYFLSKLMSDMREAIKNDTFLELKKQWVT